MCAQSACRLELVNATTRVVATMCPVFVRKCTLDIPSKATACQQVPFAAGPAMVAWHPKFTATVLIGSSSGLFTLADTTSNGYTPTHQVRTVCGRAILLQKLLG